MPDMTFEWFKTPEEREEEKNEALRRRIYLQDLKDILDTAAGYRFILNLLNRLGIERPVSSSSIQFRNLGEDLLNDCQQASFKKCIQLISDIRSNLDA